MALYNFIKNLRKDPALASEAANWLMQKYIMRRAPARSHDGIRFSNFANFSEFHSFVAGLDEGEKRFLSSLSIGSGTVIDVGANIGLFSLLLAKYHPQSRIIAFEPGETTFYSLLQNVRSNAANVECHQLALAAHDGSVKFQMLENARANSSISNEGLGKIVPARQLDTLADELGIKEVALLKIDTEGHETNVLRGAEQLLSKIRPSTVFFEVCPELTRLAGFDPAEPAHILARAGYDLFELAHNGDLVPVQAEAAYSRVLANWVAKRPIDKT